MIGFQAGVLESALLVIGVIWGIAWRLMLDHLRERTLFGIHVQGERTVCSTFE